MLEHLYNPFKCLEECKRVLSEEGIMIHTLPNRAWKMLHFFLSLVRNHKTFPEIHGVSKSHFREWLEFNPNVWERKFKSSNLKILKKINLPFYTGHSNRFIPLLKLGNRLHISVSKCFILAVK